MTYLNTANVNGNVTGLLSWLTVFLILCGVADQVVADPEASDDGPAKTWNVQYDKSTLGFRGDYGGSGFDGEFRKFSAIIQFDPKHPETGHFDVSVDVTSVTTFNDDWDQVIGERDWFDIKGHPQSRYVTDSIKPLDGGGYTAMGILDLKGKQHDVELRFHWQEYPDGEVKVTGQARMLGAANVNRTEFGIGEGSWAQDSTVGFNVMVNVDLLLKPGTQ